VNDDPTVLLSEAGQKALARVEALMSGTGLSGTGTAGTGTAEAGRPETGRGGRPGELAVAAALRKEFPADLAAAAMAQQELRAAASAKFARAAEMLFTRGGYEQSSGEVIARHRAARLSGARRVADLCCGIGGDLIALAADPAVPLSMGDPDREILAVDRDPVHARLALHNADVYRAAGYGAAGYGAAGAKDRVRACVADVRDVPLSGFDAVFIDPARRSDGRGGGTAPGRFRAGVSEPPLDWCYALTEQVAAVCVKAAPGLPAELIPPGWEAEFIAEGRDLKEAVLWSPALSSPSGGSRGPRSPDPRSPGSHSPGPDSPAREAGLRRATVLPEGHTLTAVPGDPVPVAEPGEYLLDPSPAVTRAGLVEDLARTLGAWKIDERIAFLCLGEEKTTPFARTLRVLHSAPWNEKRFAVRLRELGIGAADIRRRGLAGDVDQIRRRLKLAGPRQGLIVLTRVHDRPWGLICISPGGRPPAVLPRGTPPDPAPRPRGR
jgi:hypothetical protein